MIAIVCSAITASLVPARGVGVPIVSWVVTLAIALLFFLYGARLSTREALDGLKHWRLHLVILCFTFVLFPLIGLGLRFLLPGVLSPGLVTGMMYVTLLPSTVNSSITFTFIGKGNVAGAIVSASLSNLLGVFLTPLLVVALMSTTSGVQVSGQAVIDITLQLLLPFVLGQIARRWIADWVVRNKSWLKHVDQTTIVLVVYSAFSAGMREGIWTRVTWGNIAALIVICLAVIGLMLALTWFVSGRLGFSRADRVAIQMCGTKKSLATGLPMASVLFAGQPIGLLVLPLMIFHQLQLMACSALASRYSRRPDDEPDRAEPERSR